MVCSPDSRAVRVPHMSEPSRGTDEIHNARPLRECPRLWVLRLSFDKLNIRSLNSPNLKAEHVEHFRPPKQLGMQTLNTTLSRRHAYQHYELRRTARARRNRCFIFHARRMTTSIIVIIFSLSATAECAGDAAMEAAAIVA